MFPYYPPDNHHSSDVAYWRGGSPWWRLKRQLQQHKLNDIAESCNKDIRVTGGTESLIWSIGSIPLMIMSAFVDTNDGITSPGQSQRINDSSIYNVYNEPACTRPKIYNNQKTEIYPKYFISLHSQQTTIGKKIINNCRHFHTTE